MISIDEFEFRSFISKKKVVTYFNLAGKSGGNVRLRGEWPGEWGVGGGVEPLIPDGTESGEIKGVARRKERVWCGSSDQK